MLIVDDEPDILETTCILLELGGYEVRTVADAREVLATLSAYAPDVVLQDVNMPGLDVVALVRAIRASPEHRGVKVLLFTAAAQAQAIHERAGSHGVIRKPVEADELYRRVAEAAGGAPTA